jgi:hypothetical protein
MSLADVRLEFYDRLGDSWRDLADALDVPARTVRGFEAGDEPRGIWQWVKERRQLGRLPAALRAIGRPDLADLLDTEPAPAVTADAIDFTALINERVADFVGRRRFTERLWTKLDDDSVHSGYLFVHGEPGIGKTALLAKLVRNHTLVHHFNSALTGVTSREKFLRNVCAQLILRYKLPYEGLPARATSDSGFLLTLLATAAERQRVVVAVDAVDEAVAAEDAQNRLFLPPALPRGVFFVVTMRDPDDIELYVDEPRDLPLLETDAENQQDVREYIGLYLTRHQRVMARRLAQMGLTSKELIALLAERSEGNFMYLRHVLRGIQQETLGGVDADGIRHLPRGLRAYYAQLEKQLVSRITEPERELAILGVLAAWPSPLTAHRLARFAGENITRTRAVLRRWAPFLNQVPDDAQPRFALYHASFRDFLAQRLDMQAVRERIGTAIESGRA